MLSWPGREGLDEFDSRVDDKAQMGRGLAHIPGVTVKGRGGEAMITTAAIYKFGPAIQKEQRELFMTIQKAMIEEQTEDTKKVIDLYMETVKRFRGEVKNDISSIRAAAAAVEESVHKMGRVYQATALMLTSAEFVQAIANAERMAAALKAISELQSHSITFAVLDKKAAA